MQDFGSKAQTLHYLQDVLSTAAIAPMVWFSLADWQLDSHSCIANIKSQLGDKPLIVRSSSGREDTLKTSNAGAFTSLINVRVNLLREAIDRVFSSYGSINLQDEVLVQPMLESVVRSGVVFSHDPNTGAPYRIINWAEGSDTTIVTGGRGGRMWQSAAGISPPEDSIFSPIVLLLEDLLTLFDGIPIDCEFAVTVHLKTSKLWLLQVRPLIFESSREAEETLRTRLEQIKRKVNRGMKPHPFLLGHRTVYGVMPDWNPAEIIGIRPKPLALSLYRELITDSTWAYQRHNYGYRNLRSFILMPNFFGLPYIDARVSFNSFIPADLNEDIGARLVDLYINKLIDQPESHDKVEFDVVWSCYIFDLPEQLAMLGDVEFCEADKKALVDSLRKLTNSILHPKSGLWLRDVEKVTLLRERRSTLLRSDLGPVEKVYWLIEDAKRYGTLPFAGLARAGFIAVQLFKSLVSVGVFSELDYELFMRSITTVSGQMKDDKITKTRKEFLDLYGHLRPGTYDILSPRYDEAPERYFDWSQGVKEPESPKLFVPTSQQLSEIDSLLPLHGINLKASELIAFMRSAIEQRELAKFEFSRNLSDALVLITQIGHKNDISTDNMAFCDYSVFRELQASEITVQSYLQSSIERGKSRYTETLNISMPPLIIRPDDVLAFEWPVMMPNFITRKRVTAPVIALDCLDKLMGAIVCIPNADPGFDWLFSHSIAGFITAWGGANSHMAIRAGEQGLPAVIGAGELMYRRWSGAALLQIDCAEQRIEVLK